MGVRRTEDSVEIASIGTELSTRRMRTLRGAIRAVFTLVAMASAGGAVAQGGVCQTGCDDDELPPWIITPGDGGGGWSPSDPCGGFSCDGGGNDVPPDEGGGSNPPRQPTACESFLTANQPPQGCRINERTREPAFGSGCNFSAPAFMPTYMSYTRHFAAACNMQMQCYWAFDEKQYCDGRVREEAYAGCSTHSSSSEERAACVDKAGSFVSGMTENAMNLMPFSVIRANVACARWKGEYDAVCR